ncbi:hypothetical protein EDB84DRAFT_476466 [Lactarius hengduanensis]|nr:hypothetical protein EDB84DRAFT_476466 [Lactarius hengduanensis]
MLSPFCLLCILRDLGSSQALCSGTPTQIAPPCCLASPRTASSLVSFRLPCSRSRSQASSVRNRTRLGSPSAL